MADRDPRFEVEDEDLKNVMRDVAKRIDLALKQATAGRPERYGFALFMFGFSDPAFFWISNADRSDMMKALREFIAREEGQ